MKQRFYIDASIWIDLYEDRKGHNGEPLGDYALKLLVMIISKNNTIVISDHLLRELEKTYSIEKINGMFKIVENIIDKIIATCEQHEEARKIAIERKLPKGDALHAIIARDNELVLVTRDKHFKQLNDISVYFKPEDLA